MLEKANPEFNCEKFQIEVREETENIFDEKLYKSRICFNCS